MPDFKATEAFADSVVLTIKSAISPILERLASIEARIGPLADVRDRVLTLEAKTAPTQDLGDLFTRLAAVEARPLPELPDSVIERVAAAEARLDAIGNLRDRVVTMETKAAIPPPIIEPPPPVDLTPVLQRMTAAEAQLAGMADVRDLRDRIVAVETKAAIPPPAVEMPPPVDLGPVLQRMSAAEASIVALTPVPNDGEFVELTASLTGLLQKELSVLAPIPRLQKRVIRDASGRVDRVVEEPVTD